MQRLFWGLSVVCVSTAFAEPHAINHYAVERLVVAVGETNSAASLQFAAEADGVVKLGPGMAEVDVGGLSSPETVKIAVHEGTLRLASTSGAAQSVEPPAVIASKASLWLQAGVNCVSPTNGTAGVDCWYDVREPEATRKASATGTYPMARMIGAYNQSTKETVYDYPESQAIETPVGSRTALYFHGGASSCWMRFLAADHASGTYLKCFHTFAVIFPKETWGYLYGTVDGSVPLFAEPGSTLSKLAAQGSYFNYGGTMNIASARFYVDGVLTDGQSAIRNALQVQELEFDHRHASWGCLFRNAGNGRYGGDWVGEIITFERHLSAEERLAVSNYLLAKWLGKSSVAPGVALELASGSTAEVGVDGTVPVTGEGEVIHTGSGVMNVYPAKGAEAAATFAQSGTGSLRAEVEALRIRPAAGEKAVVSLDTSDGQVLTIGDAATDETVAVEGTGSVRLEQIPDGTRVLSATTRELVLGARRQTGGAVPAGEIYATIVNGDAEQRFIANPNAGSEYSWSSQPTTGGTLDSWTYETVGGFCILNVKNELGNWTFSLDVPDDRDRFASVQGKGCLSLKMQTTASTAMTVPQDGDYEFSYFATARRGYDAGFLDVSIVTDDGAVVHEICRHPILLAEGWRPYRYLVRGVKAGAYRLQLRLDCLGGDKSAHVDDLKMRLVAGADAAATRCAVPNGGFNVTSGSISEAGTFSKDNLPDGWTLTQGEVGSAVTTAREAVNLDVALATRWHRPANNTAAPAGSFYNPSGRYGEAQLNFRSNAGMADSAEFTVPAGRWKVRVNAGKWTFRAGADVVSDGNYDYVSSKWNKTYGNYDLSPTCGASVFVNGVETNLGATPGISSYKMADYTVANAFTVAEGDTVKIRLRQDTAPNANGTVMMAVNEVWLERAEDSANLVRNGSFEQGKEYYDVTDWTLEKNKDLSASSNAHRYNPYKPNEQGTTRCTGDWALLLVDAASAKQEITFPQAGNYRLSFKSRARFMDTNGTVDNSTHGGNRVRAWLQDAAGNALPIFQTADVYSTNFVEHAATFAVTEAGTYTLNLNGCNIYPTSSTGRTAKNDRVVYIDDVEVVALAARDVVPPDLDENLDILLGKGTKLRLDFVGEKKIGSLKVGNKRLSGHIGAGHASGVVSGPGSLYVEPRGFYLSVR